jgi:hypothetical protein
MKLLGASGGVFYHEETPEKAAEAVATATNANPAIEGWAFIGGWPLFTTGALKWEPGKIKVVSCDALPAQLGYLRVRPRRRPVRPGLLRVGPQERRRARREKS